MNPFTSTSVELSSLFAQGVVNVLLQSTALILAGLIAARLLRKHGSAVQSAVYRGTLAAVFICPLASFALNGLGFQGWTIRLPEIAVVGEPVQQPLIIPVPIPSVMEKTTANEIVPGSIPERDGPEFPNAETALIQAELVVSTGQTVPAEFPVTVSDTGNSPLVMESQTLAATASAMISIYLSLAAIWIVGAMFMLVRLSIAYWQLRTIRRQSVLADENELAICNDLAERIRVVSPQVLRNPQLSSPCLTGVSSPAILLPAGIQERFLLEKAFAHELAHLQRHDNLWNLAQRISLALFFFQPLIWLLVRRLETTAEEVCDDCVVSHCADRTGYARQLVELAESRHNVPGLAGIGMFQCKSVLGHRIVRILDNTRQLTTGVSRPVITFIGAAAIVCAILGGLVGSGKSPLGMLGMSDSVEQDSDESSGKLIEFAGRILDSDGKPVPNADIKVLPSMYHFYDMSEPEPYATVKSKSDGSFSVSFLQSRLLYSNNQTDRSRNFKIVASAPGHGLNWISGFELQPEIPDSGNHRYPSIELKLTRADCPVELRLVDSEGNPVSGARVQVEDLKRFPKEDIGPFYESIQQGKSLDSLFSGSHFVNFLATPKFTSNAKGEVRIEGLGDNRVVNLKITGTNIAVQIVDVATFDAEPKTVGYGGMFDQSTTFHGAKSTIALAPTQPVRGRIIDAETREPLAGVTVFSDRFSGNEMLGGVRILQAVSNEEGRFELIGMPKGVGNGIVVVPNDDQPYFMMKLDVPEQAGLDPVAMEIGLHRGIWVKGRVTDEVTKEPVVGARAFYMPFQSNSYATRSPVFDPKQYLPIYNRYVTDSDGTFKTVGFPGRAVLGIQTVNEPYPVGMGWDGIDDVEKEMEGNGQVNTINSALGSISPTRLFPNAMKQIEIDEKETGIRVDFQLSAGFSVPIRVVDSDDNPLIGVNILGLRSSRDRNQVSTDSTIAASGFLPGEKRELIFHHIEKRLSAVIQLDADQLDRDGQLADPVLVKLMPDSTITGRVVNAVGDPVVGQPVVSRIGESRDYQNGLRQVSTDKDGKFEIKTAYPGTFYQIHIETADDLYSIAKHLNVEPGEHIDLGTIDISTRERPEPKRTLIESTTVPLIGFSGRVLDKTGRPVPNADIAITPYGVHSWDGTQISPYLATKTDAAGAFAASFPLSSMRQSNYFVDRERAFNIFASAPGFGMNWTNGIELVPKILESGSHRYESIELVLTESKNSIELKLIDAEGNPVRDARATVNDVHRFASENMSGFFESISQGLSPSALFNGAVRANYVSTKEYFVDENGLLQIDGLGDNRMVTLKISGPSITTQIIQVATVDTPSVTVSSGDNVGESTTYHGAKSTITCEPTQPIVGRIVDAETKEPMSGVSICSTCFSGDHFSVFGRVATVSGADGSFELSGMPHGMGNKIVVIPNKDQPNFAMAYEVPMRAGLESVEMEIELPRGVWIEGRVTDTATKEPVPGANVYYMPFLSNNHAAKSAAFANEQDNLGAWDRHLTGQDGSFKTVGLPGKAVLGIGTAKGPYPAGMGWVEIEKAVNDDGGNGAATTFARQGLPSKTWPTAMKQIEIAESETSYHIDFELNGGLSIPLRLVDNNNEPLTNVESIRMRSSRDGFFKCIDSDVQATGFQPNEKRAIVFFHAEKQISTIVTLDAAELPKKGELVEPVTVKLLPNSIVTGRVVNEVGDPVAGQTIVFAVSGGRNFGPRLSGVSTDKNGKFVFDRAYSGTYYHVDLNSMEYGHSIANHLDVEPGEHIDLGTIDISIKERPEPKRTLIGSASDVQSPEESTLTKDSAPNAADETVTFSGTVVDLAGKPVGDATVSLRDFSANSDANGLFKLEIPNSFLDTMPSTRWSLTVSREGYGKGFVGASPGLTDGLRPILADDIHPIAGKIVDPEGNPVSGAVVNVEQIQLFGDIDFGELLRKTPGKNLGSLPGGLGYIDEKIGPVTSAADGTFTIRGIGSGRIARLSILGDTVALQKISVATADIESVEVGNADMIRSGHGVSILGCNPTVIAEPTQPIEGVVIDRDTKQPLPGVEVSSYGFLNTGRSQLVGQTDIKTITDQQGRFRLVGMPKGTGNSIIVGAISRGDPSSPVVPQSFSVPEAPGLDPIQMELAVQRGVWIRGKAVDAETGEPIPWANVQYRPYINNGIATKLTTDQHLNDSGWGPETDTEGNFRVIALPGPAAIGLIAHDPKYPAGQGWETIPAELKSKAIENTAGLVAVPLTKNSSAKTMDETANVFVGRNLHGKWTFLQSIDVPASGIDDLVLKIGRGVAVKVTTVDEAGTPVTRVDVNYARMYREKTFQFDTADFELAGFLPGQKRVAMFHQPEKKLGAIANVNADEDLAEQITLQRMSNVTARLVDSQGQPVQGGALKFEAIDKNGMSLFHFQKRESSDSEGRVSQWLIPGTYHVSIDAAHGFSGLKKITIGTAELIELGDLDVSKKLAVHVMSQPGEDYRKEIAEIEAKRSKLDPVSTNGPVK